MKTIVIIGKNIGFLNLKLGNIEIKIIKENLSFNESKYIEEILIEFCGRKDLRKGTLYNLTDGGEGIVGYIHTNEAKDKISKRSIELWKNKEHINKMKINAKGLNNPFSDKNIYLFYHKEYGTINCTQYELRKSYNLTSSKLTGLIKGNQLSTKGWKIKY